jgi:4-hydroxyphenylacetate 3-monooxygenase
VKRFRPSPNGSPLVISRRRYAEMLAPVMANEVFVTCIQPLREGEDAYAMAFAVPINAKGLMILSRKSYEGARRASSTIRWPAASMRE